MQIGKIKLISNSEMRKIPRKQGDGEFMVSTAYVDLGGLYPERVDFFINDYSEVLGRGEWEVPVTARLFNGRLRYDLDFKNATPIVAKTTSTTTAKATA